MRKVFRERRGRDKELDQAMDLTVALQAGPEAEEQDMPMVVIRREEAKLEVRLEVEVETEGGAEEGNEVEEDWEGK